MYGVYESIKFREILRKLHCRLSLAVPRVSQGRVFIYYGQNQTPKEGRGGKIEIFPPYRRRSNIPNVYLHPPRVAYSVELLPIFRNNWRPHPRLIIYSKGKSGYGLESVVSLRFSTAEWTYTGTLGYSALGKFNKNGTHFCFYKFWSNYLKPIDITKTV